MARNICPKCGSGNISFQREQTATVGVAKHTVYGKRRRGCLMGFFYWCLIGWWIWIFKLLLPKRRKKLAEGVSVDASKSINRTMGVCQNCGHTWKA